MHLTNFSILLFLFQPWAFGCVHKEFVSFLFILNIIFIIGNELTKPNKTINGTFLNSKHSKIPFNLKIVIFIGIYISVSILNSWGTFNNSIRYVEINSYIKYLPSGVLKSETIFNICVLFCNFFSFYYIPKIFFQKQKFGEGQLNRLLLILTCNGGLISLAAVLHFLSGSEHLLWFYDNPDFNYSRVSFGPFAYRGNGCAYILLTNTLGFFCLFNQVKLRNNFGISIIILICHIVSILAVYLTQSRAGLIFNLLLCFILYSIYFRLKYTINNLVYFAFFTGILAFGLYIIYERVDTRLKASNRTYEISLNSPDEIHKITLCLRPIKNEASKPSLIYQLSLADSSGRKDKFEITKDKEVVQIKNGLGRIIAERKLPPGINEITVELYQNKHLKIYYSLPKSNENYSIFLINSDITFEKAFVKIVKTIELTKYSSSVLKYSCEFNGNELIYYDEKIPDLILSYPRIKIQSSRLKLIETSIKMFWDRPYFGYGIGSWTAVYPMYRGIGSGFEAWVHCDPLEIVLCYGMIGGGLFFINYLFVHFQFWKNKETHSWCWIGLAIGNYFLICYSFVDFPFSVPACSTLFWFINGLIYYKGIHRIESSTPL